MRKWTNEEEQMLIDLYPHKNIDYLVEAFNRSFRSIYTKAKKMELKKDPEYIKEMLARTYKSLTESGKITRFKKGQKSWNSGTKGVMKANKASFKKGNVPVNIKPVGSKRFDKDGYEIKKTESGAWLRVQHIEWEKVNGPIPEGYKLRLKVPDKTCLDVSQMFLVSNAENMLLNSVQRYPDDIKNTINLLSKIKRKLKKYEKQD